MNFYNSVTNNLGCSYNGSLFSIDSPPHSPPHSCSPARRMENEEAIYKPYNKTHISLHRLQSNFIYVFVDVHRYSKARINCDYFCTKWMMKQIYRKETKQLKKGQIFQILTFSLNLVSLVWTSVSVPVKEFMQLINLGPQLAILHLLRIIES